MLRVAAAIAATALAASARAEPMTMLIWGGGRTPEAAARAMAGWKAAGERAGLKLPEGFPRIMDSTPIQGLKPGFQIVVLGFCAPESGPAVLARMKAVEPQAYLRNVEYSALACPEVLPEATARDAAAPDEAKAAPAANTAQAEEKAAPADAKTAPETTASPAEAKPASPPPPELYVLVAAAGRKRAELDAKAKALVREVSAKVKLAPGHPFVEARERLALVDERDDPYLLVLGVCADKRADVLARLTDAQAVEVRRGTPACPEVLEGARVDGIEKALVYGDRGFALELLARGALADASRRELALSAAGACAPEVLDRLMAPGPIDATAALERALACTYSHAPDAVARMERTVRRLVAGGAVARGHADWIATALERDCVPFASQLVAAGADPRTAAAQVVRAAVAGSPEALAWVVAQHVDVNAVGADGETALGRAVIDRNLEAVQALLRVGATPSIRGRDGLGPLDRVLLPGREAWPGMREALLAARPAFAAAAAGDVKALAALPATALGEAWGGWSPLAVAAVLGQDPAALYLLDHGARADLRVGVGLEDGGHDILSLAIDGGATKLALRLVLRGGALDTPAGSCALIQPSGRGPIRAYRDPRASTPKHVCVKLRPIHRAALAGQLMILQALLEQRVDPDATDASERGLTATMLAVETGHFELLKPLAAKGAKPALTDATFYGAVAHALVRDEPGPALDALQGAFGPKVLEAAPGALVVAVLEQDGAVVERLLQAGAGSKAEAKRALWAACERGLQGSYELLQRKGFTIGKAFWGDCVEQGE